MIYERFWRCDRQFQCNQSDVILKSLKSQSFPGLKGKKWLYIPFIFFRKIDVMTVGQIRKEIFVKYL